MLCVVYNCNKACYKTDFQKAIVSASILSGNFKHCVVMKNSCFLLLFVTMCNRTKINFKETLKNVHISICFEILRD